MSKKRQKMYYQQHWEPPAHQKTRPTKFNSANAKNCPWNQHLARICPPNSQTRASTQDVHCTRSKWFYFWRLTTSVYGWKDDSVASHLWTGSEFRSEMKSYSPSNKPAIIRTAGAGAPRLSAHLLSSSTAKIQSAWRFGSEFSPPAVTHWFSSIRGGTMTKTFTTMRSWMPWWFLGPVVTLANSKEHFNKILLQLTRVKAMQEWCKANFLDFTSAGNPFHGKIHHHFFSLDYNSIWLILETRACAKPHKNLEALKQSLQQRWDRLSAEELWLTTLNFRKHFALYIEAEGGQCETN